MNRALDDRPKWGSTEAAIAEILIAFGNRVATSQAVCGQLTNTIT